LVIWASPGSARIGRRSDEPFRGAEVALLAARAFDDQLAVGVVDADRFVMPAVEQRGHSQFQVTISGFCWLSDRASADALSAFFMLQLLLKVGAGGEQRGKQAAGQREQHADDDGEPELAIHRHGVSFLTFLATHGQSKPSLRARSKRSCQRESWPVPPTCRAELPATPFQMASLLKLKTGCRSLRCEAGRISGYQIVEYQRFGIGRRVIGQHHVGLQARPPGSSSRALTYTRRNFDNGMPESFRKST
jgi:hypothetical protein